MFSVDDICADPLYKGIMEEFYNFPLLWLHSCHGQHGFTAKLAQKLFICISVILHKFTIKTVDHILWWLYYRIILLVVAKKGIEEGRKANEWTKENLLNFVE